MQQFERVDGSVVEGFFYREDSFRKGLRPHGGGVTGGNEDLCVGVGGEELRCEGDTGIVGESGVLGEELIVPILGGPVEGFGRGEVLEVEGLVPVLAVLRVLVREDAVVVVDVGEAEDSEGCSEGFRPCSGEA